MFHRRGREPGPNIYLQFGTVAELKVRFCAGVKLVLAPNSFPADRSKRLPLCCSLILQRNNVLTHFFPKIFLCSLLYSLLIYNKKQNKKKTKKKKNKKKRLDSLIEVDSK